MNRRRYNKRRNAATWAPMLRDDEAHTIRWIDDSLAQIECNENREVVFEINAEKPTQCEGCGAWLRLWQTTYILRGEAENELTPLFEMRFDFQIDRKTYGRVVDHMKTVAADLKIPGEPDEDDVTAFLAMHLQRSMEHFLTHHIKSEPRKK